jgi:hypothetical protein
MFAMDVYFTHEIVVHANRFVNVEINCADWNFEFLSDLDVRGSYFYALIGIIYAN